MRVFLLSRGDLLVAKWQHSVQKRKHENFVYWLGIFLKRNKIWLLFTFHSSSGETLLKESNFTSPTLLFPVWVLTSGMNTMNSFFPLICFLAIASLTYSMYWNASIWYLNQSIGNNKIMLSFPFLTDKMPHFFILQPEKRQKIVESRAPCVRLSIYVNFKAEV